jgi:uncharacterized protein YbbC (DUF1343 family)
MLVSACQTNRILHLDNNDDKSAHNNTINNEEDLKHPYVPKQQTYFALGAQNIKSYLPRLKGKRVGLIVNQTSVMKHHNTQTQQYESQHLVDFLRSQQVNVVVMFAPEHGVRGNKGAGEYIQSGKDAATLIPIQSIYGANKIPPNRVMENLDVVIFDIQDVGTRFYTYISSMHYMMEAAAKHKVAFIVLDRPNPNGEFIDGPVLNMTFQSFVGMHPIPVLHGLTVGELALMIKGEKWIQYADNLDLSVVSMAGYHKSMEYRLPVPPSPNLPNYQAIRLYPSLCFFEPSAVSIGRGTDFPFQVTGHDEVQLGEFTFTPVSKPFSAPNPKLINSQLFGLDLQQSHIAGLDLSLLIQYYEAFRERNIPFFISTDFMDKLAGTDKLRKAIEAGESAEQIRQSWQPNLAKYKQLRQKYLLYPE